jgi:hypothetical protein
VTGVLVEPRDPGRWPTPSSPDRDQTRRAAMGDAGLARMNARFTVERMVAGQPPYTCAWPARRGHCASACARLNPQAFIIPGWHIEDRI